MNNANPIPPIAEQVAPYLLTNEGIAIATYIGVVISIGGLLFSFLAFIQAKRAKTAASDAKNAVYRIDSVMEITKSISILNDVQTHLRNKSFSIIPDKILAAHGHLTVVKNGCPDLSESNKNSLIQACAQITRIKNSLERNLEDCKTPVRVAQTNKVLTTQTENLQEILESIRRNS